jgi:hypothetical protein
LTLGVKFTHVQSMRLASGQEVLVARVLTTEDKAGFGFSLQLDATEARHMAEWHAGMRAERPKIEPALGHPWETAYLASEAIPWAVEPGFAGLKWPSG